MKLSINPPLLNSANPWCSNIEQLKELYDCPYTGAVTTRTALLKDGFQSDDSVHQFAFFNPLTHRGTAPNPSTGSADPDDAGSLNTLGYSPLPLKDYLGFIKTISDSLPPASTTTAPASSSSSTLPPHHPKPFIISVTGTAEDVVECYKLICSHQRHVRMVLAMEVNLSCPNIPNKPPPAYDSQSMQQYLSLLKAEIGRQAAETKESSATEPHSYHVPIGIKTPPYTYSGQYEQLIDALVKSANEMEPKSLPCPLSFITATNTLGSSLLLKPIMESILNSSDSRTVQHHALSSANDTGIGGLAGAPIHPLALGNVYTIKGLLFQYPELEGIQIIGVGGVSDKEGFLRMRAVGAAAVGVGTALGKRGVGIFGEILEGSGQRM